MRYPPLAKVGKVCITYERDVVGGEYVDGEWVASTKQQFTTHGNIQPNINFNQRMLLPEGDRSKNCIAVYCIAELLQAEEGDKSQGLGREGDKVLWQGKKWEVKSSMFYQMGVLNHCEAVCLRVDDV